jgi:2-polyprenyl-3-methyl-5-hydroxy-6-metoxy-1,4-benzoquinol methylase
MTAASLGGARAAEDDESAPESGPSPAGNLFDKYGSRNPVVRRLMGGFEAALDELLEMAAPTSILDVGCGEGVLTERWAQRLEGVRVVGVDLASPTLRSEWGARARPNLRFLNASGETLPFEPGEFDLVTAVEVVEHVADARQVLAEMARVAGRHLLVSVPREPLWRALNLTRGAYLRQLGNTPGHRNHWSRRSFMRLLDEFGEVLEARTPVPWTMLLVRVA